MEIIAHRGASYLAPENTVASARLAWEKNADAVEVDVYLTTDQRVVVIHDRTTKRTGGEELEVANCTAEQLRRLDVGSFKDASFAGERIPVLEKSSRRCLQQEALRRDQVRPGGVAALEKIFIEVQRSQIVIIATVGDGHSLETTLCRTPTYWWSARRGRADRGVDSARHNPRDQAVAAGLAD
jgi:hypothetical protein